MIRHRTALLAAFACTIPLLPTGCLATDNTNSAPVGAKTNPQAAKLLWFNTIEGTVQCLNVAPNSYYLSQDCDWNIPQAHHIVANVNKLPGHWVTTKLGVMYCLTFQQHSGYNSYDCDWEHTSKTVPTVERG